MATQLTMVRCEDGELYTVIVTYAGGQVVSACHARYGGDMWPAVMQSDRDRLQAAVEASA